MQNPNQADQAGQESFQIRDQSARRLLNVLDPAGVFVWSFDVHSRVFVYCSDAVEKIYGYTADCFTRDASMFLRTIFEEDPHVMKKIEEYVLHPEPFSIEFRIKHKSGQVKWVQLRGIPVQNEQGRVDRLDGIVFDVTDQKEAEGALLESEQKFRRLLDLIPNAVVLHTEGTIQYANEGALRMLGLKTPSDILNRQVWDFFHEDSIDESKVRVKKLMENGTEGVSLPSVEQKFVHSDGRMIYGETVSFTIRDEGTLAVLCVTQDVTQQKQAQSELKHLAYHDPLTNLPNRRYLTEHLTKLLANSQRGTSHSVMFVDMDRFKLINDSFGHQFGDIVLRAITDRIRQCVPEGDALIRIGGDEFAVLLPNRDKEYVACLAEALLCAFESPMQMGEREFFMTPSIGIAMAPENGTESDILLRNADAAMYSAKQHGGNCFVYYDPSVNQAWKSTIDLETSLRKGLTKNEFILHYQPKVDTKTGATVSVEALIRWQKEGQGMVSPGEFIPAAEASGLIVPMGEWVLREACRQNKAWQESGFRPVVMAVNVSPKQFELDNMSEIIRDVLAETGLDPQWLAIEITESVLMQNSRATQAMLDEIREMGVRIAIDDFGTGYSSLAYLRKWKPSSLKIDRSFINGLSSESEDQSIVTAMIQLAHGLGMTVIAEGVETEEQLQFLAKAGCDIIQGFLFSKPIEATDFAKRYL